MLLHTINIIDFYNYIIDNIYNKRLLEYKNA